jgi:site-specific DNA recombinase
VEELKKNEIEIFIKDKPIADTPDGRFMFNILGAVSEYEKEKILERTRRGRLFKARQKGVVGYLPAYGYNYIKKDSSGKEGYFEINKKETESVKLIFELYTNFQSLTRVQKELTLMQVRPRIAEQWCRSTLRQILRNGAYTGTGYYNKRQSVIRDNGKKYQRKVKNGIKMRPKEEWIPIKFPQILDESKFALVQEILSKKFRPFGKSKYFYLLSGLIRCANCGSTFTGAGNNRHPYYRCSNRRKRLPLPKNCRVKHMRMEDLDAAVWSVISKAMMNQKILTAHISQLADEITEDGNALKEEKERLLEETSILTKKKDRLLEIYTEGNIDKEQFLRKMGDYNEEEERIKKDLGELEIRFSQATERPRIVKNIQHLCDLARQNLQSLDQKQKQQILRYLLCEVVLDSNARHAAIAGRIPIEDQDIKELFTLKDRAPYMFSKVYVNPWKKGKLLFPGQIILSPSQPLSV